MARTVCRTNIKNALRKSWDTGTYEDVNDEWMAEFGRNHSYLGVAPMCGYNVRLWNHETGEELFTNVGGCTSMTEYVEYATQCLMQMWKERLARQRVVTFYVIFDELVDGEWSDRKYFATFEADADTSRDELAMLARESVENDGRADFDHLDIRELDRRAA